MDTFSRPRSVGGTPRRMVRKPLAAIANNVMMSRSMDFSHAGGVGLNVAKKVAGGEWDGRKEEVVMMLNWLGGLRREGVLVGLRALQVLLREARWRRLVVAGGGYQEVMDLMRRNVIDGDDKSCVIVACNCFSNLSHAENMEVPKEGFIASVVRKLVEGGGRDTKLTQCWLSVIQGMVGNEVRRRAFWGELIGVESEGRNNTATELFRFLAATLRLRNDERSTLRSLSILVNLSNEEIGKKMAIGNSLVELAFELLSAVPNSEIIYTSLRLLANCGRCKERLPRVSAFLLNKASSLLALGDIRIASSAAEVLLLYRPGGGELYDEVISNLIVCGVVKSACVPKVKEK